MIDHENREHTRRLERRIRELEERTSTIERQLPNMANQAEIDALTAKLGTVSEGLATVSSDLGTTKTALQKEIDELAKANPAIDLTALNAAVDPLDATVTALDTAAKDLGGLAPLKPEPEGGGGTPAAEPVKAVYAFSATNFEQPDARFTASGFETHPANGDPVPLYYFSGDTAAGEVTGAEVPGYTVYTGPTQAAPAA